MSTQSEIERITSAKAGIKAALEKKGVDVGERKLDEYAPLVEQISPGVESFKGRTGAVTPQAGDYTAEMVGARPNTWVPTAGEVGAAPASHTHTTGQISGVMGIAQGGTGVSNMVDTDYATNRPRGIVLQASEPASVPIGCLVGVYE